MIPNNIQQNREHVKRYTKIFLYILCDTRPCDEDGDGIILRGHGDRHQGGRRQPERACREWRDMETRELRVEVREYG